MKNHNVNNKIVQIVFWAILFLFVFRFIKTGREEISAAIYRSIIIISVFIGLTYLNVFVLIPKLLKQKKQVLYGITILVVIIGIPYFFVEFDIVHKLYQRPNFPTKDFPKSDRPLYTSLFLVTTLFIFVSSIIKLAIDGFIQEKEKGIAEKEHLLMENKYMRSQMNPHFFLNALNNLRAINKLSPNESDKYIDTLSSMMRYVTYDCKNDKVELFKEVNYIKNYIYFQRIKDEDVNVNVSLEIQNKDYLIEPMILLPFIENSFKYGTFEDAEDELKISIRQSKGELVFECTNIINKILINQKDPSYSELGIQNVRNRLEIQYPNAYKLEAYKTESMFIVKLKINAI